MLAVSQMSHSAQGVIYLIAFILFIVAAIFAWVPSKLIWASFVATGFALFAFVLMWNNFALS